MRRQQFSCGRGSIRRATVFLAIVALIATASPGLAALPALSIANAQVTEPDTGTTPAKVKVSLSRKSAKAVSVKFATVDRSAKAGQDYVAKDGTVKFPAGARSKTIKIAVKGDAMDEKNEVFLVKLSNAKGASIEDGSAKVKIIDNDDPPTLSIADANVLEGDSGTSEMSFEVSLSQASGKRIFVSYETEDDSGGGDFVPESGELEFAPGDTTENAEISVNGDALDEADEMFMIWLSDPANATIADGEATGTITDDDGAPSVSIDEANPVTEGSSLSFPVSLSHASGQQITVAYSVAPGPLTESADFNGSPGSVVFAPGDTSKTISVPTNDDAIDEDPESVTVTLNSPANATLGNPFSASGRIDDNDAAPTLTVGNAGGNEGTFITFTITKTGLTEKIVNVRASTADDTSAPAATRATASADYVPKVVDFGFGPGETTKFFTVTANDDQIDELNETFRVVLSNEVNATLGTPSQAVGTIIDTDPAPSVNVESKQIGEGLSAPVRISLSHASSQDMTLDIVYTDGTAVAWSDYIPNDGAVTIPAGQTQTSINVATIHDTDVEGNETFTIGVTNVSGTSGTITIVDNDF